MTDVLVWHFCADKDGKPVQRDGKPLPPIGEMERDPVDEHGETGEIVPCVRAFHGSERALDALNYAEGPWAARARLSGTIKPHGAPVDKHAASERTRTTACIDATAILRQFSYRWAERARQSAITALRAVGCVQEAAALAACAPITDRETAKAARATKATRFEMNAELEAALLKALEDK